MMRTVAIALLAALIAACAGSTDQRPESTVGGFERGPSTTSQPAQPPDNYP
jgi:hypothetical protein